jgi:hypothetical protein
MACDLKLYVYRVNERQYGVGLGVRGCEQRGDIVEEWPLDTPDDARFLATHGTSYYGVSGKVSRIADLVFELMSEDPTFVPPESLPRTVPTPEPIKPKPGLFPRIKSWFYAR